MGCCGGDREKGAVIKNDVKWEYVNLNDFKTQSCLTPLAYFYLWIMLIISVSFYAVDTFIAINLLAFNKWAGQIQPALPLKYSRWIFAGCIILSFALLIYRWARALKVMRGGKVAKSYLDPLAVRVECIRMGQGRGWRRFLVFAELTKSRKGADYVALFAYYSFEAWLRIVLAEGPRVVINGITLVSFAQANFVPTGSHAAPQGQSPFVQFWLNVGFLVEHNKMQAAVVFGMLWTCFIWIISALSLGVSVVLYLIFLWHHIPSDAGGLSGYCRKKINKRMERIVRIKTDAALKKENEIRARQEARAYREGGTFKRQPTLPDLGDASTPSLAPLSRTTTTTTLPDYTSRPGTSRYSEDTLPPMPTPYGAGSRPPPRRHATNASDASWASYNSDAPLMNGADGMGQTSRYDRAQTPASAVSTPWSARPQMDRSFTDFTHAPDGMYTNRMEPAPRPETSMSNRSRHRQISDPERYDRNMSPISAQASSATSIREAAIPDLTVPRTRTPAPYNPYFPPVSPIPEHGGRESPAFGGRPMTPSHPAMGMPGRSMTPGHAPPLTRLRTPSNDFHTPEYIAFNPTRSQTPFAVYQPSTQSRPPRSDSYSSMGHRQPSNSSRPVRTGSPAAAGFDPRPPYPPQRVNSFDDILDHY